MKIQKQADFLNLGVQGVDIYVDLYYDCSMLQNVEQLYVRKRV